MLKLARQRQHAIEPARAPSVAPAREMAAGRTALTDYLPTKNIGEPDHYTRAVQNAERELAAVRTTALPAYVAVVRRKDLDPLALEIERTRAALRVRHLLACANQHVYALESAAVHRDPMIAFLRAQLDSLAARATKLGVYAGAENQLPKRYTEIKLTPLSVSPRQRKRRARRRLRPLGPLQPLVAQPMPAMPARISLRRPNAAL